MATIIIGKSVLVHQVFKVSAIKKVDETPIDVSIPKRWAAIKQ